MKKCPFCAEEIQDAAILCRYCGSELISLKPKKWKYLTLIFHFRNADESGWVNAEGTPPASAALHFWNELHQAVSEADRSSKDDGWDVIEPRDPSCLKLEIVRNSKGYDPVRSAVGAVFTMGGSLITQAIGFHKWWISSFTLRYRKPAEETKEEVNNFWMNIRNNNEWERMEQDPITQKWYIWRRPKDFDVDNPDDDRWDKIPIDDDRWDRRPEKQREKEQLTIDPSEKDLELTESEVKLYEVLRRIRVNIAVPKGIPSNTICPDHVLQEMARSRPTNLDTLKRMSGVTEEFMKNYGKIFVDEISMYVED